MSIKFDPSKVLSKIAPKTRIKKLVKENLSLKKTALKFVDQFEFLSKADITRVALKTLKSYRARVKDDPDLRDDLIANPAQLVQRVQNEVILQIHDTIKEKYSGELARWLPSDAEEPRPEHQLNYGKTYVIGEGIDGIEPGDEFGCRCGMEILVEGEKLDLG